MKLLNPEEEIQIISPEELKKYVCQVLSCSDKSSSQCSACKCTMCEKHEAHSYHKTLDKGALTRIHVISSTPSSSISSNIANNQNSVNIGLQLNSGGEQCIIFNTMRNSEEVGRKRKRGEESEEETKSTSEGVSTVNKKRNRREAEAEETKTRYEDEASENSEVDESMDVEGGINRCLIPLGDVGGKKSSQSWVGFAKYNTTKLSTIIDVNDKDRKGKAKSLNHYAVCLACYSKYNKTQGGVILRKGVGPQKWDIYLSADGSTSKLDRHNASYHPQVVSENNREKAAEIIKESKDKGMKSLLDFGFNKEGPILNSLIKWIVMKYQPLSMVEDKYFRDLLKVCGVAKFVSSRNVREKIQLTYNVLLPQLLEIIKNQHGAFTLDTWTSDANDTYISLTIHFIDKFFNLVSFPLTCEPFYGGKDAAAIKAKIDSILRKFNIKEQNVVVLVTDNEPTMNSLGTSGMLRFDWSGCIDHLLQLVANEAFNCKSEEGVNVMKKVRELVTFMKHSSQVIDFIFYLRFYSSFFFFSFSLFLFFLHSFFYCVSYL